MTANSTRASRATSSVLRRFNLPGLAVVILFMGLWELYTRTLGANLGTLASLGQTATAFKSLVIEGPLLGQLGHTLFVALSGWILACLLGLTIGTALGLSRTFWTYTMASVDVLRSIPSISLVSIALLIFGFSAQMEMVIVVYVSQWPILLATVNSIRATPTDILDISRTFRMSQGATLRKLILPNSLPSILIGMRLSLSLSIALAVVAEMVGNPAGLGFGLVFSQQAIQPAAALAYLFVIGIVGWALNAAFVLAVRRSFQAYGPIV